MTVLAPLIGAAFLGGVSLYIALRKDRKEVTVRNLKIPGIESRLDGIDDRLDRMERKIDSLLSDAGEPKGTVKQMDKRIGVLESGTSRRR